MPAWASSGQPSGPFFVDDPHLCLPASVWVHGDYCRINHRTSGIVMMGMR